MILREKKSTTEPGLNIPDPAIPGMLAPLDNINCAAIISPDIPLYGGAAKAAFSLSVMLARQLHRSVVCVDACFTNPELADMLPKGTPLLQEQLGSKDTRPRTTVVMPQVEVIACAKGAEQDMALLCSPVFGVFISELRKNFSMVLLMLPPAPAFAGVAHAAKVTDGVVLLLDCGRTRWEAAAECRNRLVLGGSTVLGAVMNRRKFHVPAWLYNAL